ncbi:MAG: shikimate dehydrogenase family protein [Acidimicrobiia bacterium]
MRSPLRLAVLGDPIDHSRSPAIHRAAMRRLGIEGSYEARRAGPAELTAAVRELRAGTLHGMNITMPLKREAAAAADRLTPEAEAGASVNTLRLSDGLVEGHSTDVIAARSALSDPRFDPEAPVLVLGSGGAAAAAVAGVGHRVAYLAARDPARAATLADLAGPPAAVVPFGTGVSGALVINATPLGMKGEPLPEAIVELASGIIDLAYGGHPTPTVVLALESDVPVMDGVEFLVLQAAASFQWWTGVRPPLDAMLEAARKA